MTASKAGTPVSGGRGHGHGSAASGRHRFPHPLIGHALARVETEKPWAAVATLETWHGARPWAGTATVISVEAWELAGLHSNLRWAWVNLPIRANPSLRQLPNGQWVLQAFRGLELGRFDNRAAADRALAILALHGYRGSTGRW